jgi:hypothetical protein
MTSKISHQKVLLRPAWHWKALCIGKHAMRIV